MSERSGVGYRGGGGYATNEEVDSGKENDQHTRDRDGGRPDNRNFDEVEKKQPSSEMLLLPFCISSGVKHDALHH